MPYTHEEMTRAGDAAKKVAAKAIATLGPIQHEMEIMGWGQDLRAIMWRAIAELALARSGGPVGDRGPVGAGRDTEFSGSGPQRSRPVDQDDSAHQRELENRL